jgi:hypothetical protein
MEQLRKALNTTALAAALAIGLAGSTWAEFDEPVDMSRNGDNVSLPHVAIDANGDALVVWRNDTTDEIHGRTLSASGAAGGFEGFSPNGQVSFGGARVAMDALGNALVVWENNSALRIQARTRSAEGVRGPIERVSRVDQNTRSPQVALDAAGNALIVWLYGADRQFARTRSAAGDYSRIRAITPSGQHNGQYTIKPQLAVNAGGDGVVVWKNSKNNSLQARAVSTAGVIGPTVTLDRAGDGRILHEAKVAIDPKRNALILWREQVQFTTVYRLRARSLSAAGVLGPIELVARDVHNENFDVALDANGNALIVWYSVRNHRLFARTRSTAGSYGPAKRIRNTDLLIDPQVALDGNGNAMIVWGARVHTGGGTGSDPATFDYQILARVRFADGTLGRVELVSRPTPDRFQTWDAFDHQLALNADGDAVVVWQHYESATEQRIHAATGRIPGLPHAQASTE